MGVSHCSADPHLRFMNKRLLDWITIIIGTYQMPLSRLIYVSENQLDRESGSVLKQVSAVLSASNRNNKRIGLTGALVFDDMYFLQILEGERRPVWETFERIKEDERHSRVLLVELRDTPERIFGNWWMGLATRNEDTQHVFEPFTRKGILRAEEMSAQQILDVAIQLAKAGLHREFAASAIR